jgi:hypothetical protein
MAGGEGGRAGMSGGETGTFGGLRTADRCCGWGSRRRIGEQRLERRGGATLTESEVLRQGRTAKILRQRRQGWECGMMKQ